MEKPSINDLESWIQDCVAYLRDSGGFEVHEAHANEFLLLFGLAGRTVRYSDAFLLLAHSEHMSEAIPLARTALEHAITLQWVFIVSGGANRFRVDVEHDRLTHYTTLAKWLESDELAGEVAKLSPPPEGKRMPKFGTMLRELDTGNYLATTYHILSQHVHVTHAAVTSFLQPGEDEQMALNYDQDYPYPYQATYAVAAACMLARWVIAKLTNDTELLEALDQASDRLILPMNLMEQIPSEYRRRGL
ncbi:DUF5677 domain-containing protein [Promicromonospora sp. NPDC052451]|uniref:DUF5677 domain-containing protein n=1 Tax=Promicromonospora sp. NPDC052451 TaxID=3364407 RepID=UPI0037C84EED